MTKLTRFLIVAAILGSLAGGAYAAWAFRDRLAGGPSPTSPARADYDRLVAHLGGNEPAVRDELNYLASTASAPLGPADRTKAGALTSDCLDPNILLGIDHVTAFVGPPGRGDWSAYHFVGDAHKQKLRAVAGDNPSADKVLAVRRALVTLGEEFALVRKPPDWKIGVVEFGADPPPLPYLELLASGSDFLPAGKHPILYGEPRIPAFAGPDGDLLVQLEQFFNTPRARAALPPARFPKLYRDGRIPPIPANLSDYQKAMEEDVAAEMRVLLPEANPHPMKVQSLNDVYGKLERFFTAVVQFEPK
jgi:hypothetical protein